MSDDRYPAWPEMFRWLTVLKDRVETIPAIGAEQIVTGTLNVDMIPDLPWSKILKAGSSLGDLESRSATDLTSGTLPEERMPALSGDVTSVTGSVATTLATVNTDVGAFGSGTLIPIITVNAKGLVTAVQEQPIQTGALTRVNDTNITATLGGTPATALLKDVSITLGWSGTLAVSRGGTGTGTAFTAGSVVFAGASGVYSQDNANLFWDDTNNRLGIRTATPTGTLEVVETGTATNQGLWSTQISSGVTAPLMNFRKARGTPGALSTVAVGDGLAVLLAYGYDGSNYLGVGGISILASGTVASTRVPTTMRFYTATDAAPSVLTEAMQIQPSQVVQFGTTLNRVTYMDPTLGTVSIGQTGNTVAALAINRFINDAAMQYGINVTPRWDATGVEATGIRINNTLGAGIAKANGGGLVVEGITMGVGSSFGSGGYFSALFRGNHAAIAAGIGTFVHATTLALETSSNVTLWIGSDKDGTTAQDGIYFGVSKDTTLYRAAASQLTTDGKLRVSGALGIVGAPGATAAIMIGASAGIPSAGGISRVIYSTAQMPATTTTSGAGYVSEPSTAASAFTLATYAHLSFVSIVIGAGSAVTNQYGLLIGPLTTATNNFGAAIGSSSTATLWVANDADRTTSPYGIFWGASRDTNLYRIAASALKTDGSLGVGVTPTAILHLKAGTATASTAPLKFTSGTNLTAAEAGAVEFTTDDYFATITTGAARKAFILDDGARLTSGKIPIATTNGRLIDGQTPLAGTKVYYVSDTSGGAVTRKLTFIAGILTSET